ncbi:MOSC domain-containing protein [Geobacillus sp. YF-1]|uniref:MOSC domain-containing protein n=1 Tax=Geobacillus sp. YF-1 TaxID=3457480 RepID=UPI0040463408
MWIVSINVGTPKTLDINGQPLVSGIDKTPVAGLVAVGKRHLAGDGQADLVHHGGEDKAICAYPSEHFAYWERHYGRPFAAGAFGENWTLAGLTEDEACLGDIYAAGTALVQVSQPRQPCSKLALFHQLPGLPKAVIQTGKSGFYLRVLNEGVVEPGATLLLVERGQGALSIAYINRIYYHERDNVTAMEQLAYHPALSASWREAFLHRLAAQTEP